MQAGNSAGLPTFIIALHMEQKPAYKRHAARGAACFARK
jgi:hypothetical protein